MWSVLATCAWLAAAPAPAPAEPTVAEPPRVFLNETKVTTVFGERLAEVSFVAAHCEALDRYLQYSLGMPALPPPPARLEINDVPGLADIDARIVGGQVLVVLRFGPVETAADRSAAAAAQVWMTRVALAGGKPAGVGEPWVRPALASEVLAMLRPALVDLWYREGLQEPPAKLAELLAGRAPAREYFLFWRALRRSLGNTEQPVRTLIASAQGTPVLAVLKTLGKDPEAWWVLQRTEVLLSRNPVSLGPRESGESLDDMTRFVFDVGQGDVLLSGPDTLRYREIPAIRDSMQARLLALRREILRQNPVYHNAWRAFGAWLEQFQTGKPEELARLWAEYVAERQAAEQLRREVDAALAVPPSAK